MSDSPTPVVVTPKPWWESKTAMFNLLLMILGLAIYVIEGIQSGQLKPPWAIDEATTTFWLGLLNFVLRWLTTQPITAGRS